MTGTTKEVNVSTWVSATYACEVCGNRYTTSVHGQPSRVLGEGMSAEGDPPRFATVTLCKLTVAASCWSRNLTRSNRDRRPGQAPLSRVREGAAAGRAVMVASRR